MKNIKKALPYFLFIILGVYGCTASLTRQQNEVLIEILDILSITITETEDILKNNTDPTNMYVDILDKLIFMKELIQEIKNGNEPYDEEVIFKYSTKIKEIEANIKNALDKVFSSDVFFGLGKYKISDFSDEGKKSLDEFTQTIIDSQLKNFRKLFPNQTLIIVIKVIGYADETPIGPELYEILIKEIDQPLPLEPHEQKKYLITDCLFSVPGQYLNILKCRCKP